MSSRSINGLRIRPALRTIALLALAALVLAAAGCDSGVAGTYVMEETSPEGGTITVTLELKGDDKAVMTVKGGPGAVMSAEGTYSVEGDKVTVELAGDKEVYTLKDGNLTTTTAGETTVLKKK